MDIVKSFDLLLEALDKRFRNQVQDIFFENKAKTSFGGPTEVATKTSKEGFALLKNEINKILDEVLKLNNIRSKNLKHIKEKCITYIDNSYIYILGISYSQILNSKYILEDEELTNRYLYIREEIKAIVEFRVETKKQQIRQLLNQKFWDVFKLFLSALIGGIASHYLIK